jgi:hypothetical protein
MPFANVLVTLTALGFGVVGAATATDLISLREVAHAIDLPVLSGLVIGLRESMPTSLAHAIEPATGVIGGVGAACALMSPSRRAELLARCRGGTQRTVLALATLRIS